MREFLKRTNLTDFMYGSERPRVNVALISQSGLRLEILGNEPGTDGLRISDMPEMDTKDGRVDLKRIPTRVIVRSSPGKARQKYFTFLTKEGCEYLRHTLKKE